MEAGAASEPGSQEARGERKPQQSDVASEAGSEEASKERKKQQSDVASETGSEEAREELKTQQDEVCFTIKRLIDMEHRLIEREARQDLKEREFKRKVALDKAEEERRRKRNASGSGEQNEGDASGEDGEHEEEETEEQKKARCQESITQCLADDCFRDLERHRGIQAENREMLRKRKVQATIAQKRLQMLEKLVRDRQTRQEEREKAWRVQVGAPPEEEEDNRPMTGESDVDFIFRKLSSAAGSGSNSPKDTPMGGTPPAQVKKKEEEDSDSDGSDDSDDSSDEEGGEGDDEKGEKKDPEVTGPEGVHRFAFPDLPELPPMPELPEMPGMSEKIEELAKSKNANLELCEELRAKEAEVVDAYSRLQNLELALEHRIHTQELREREWMERVRAANGQTKEDDEAKPASDADGDEVKDGGSEANSEGKLEEANGENATATPTAEGASEAAVPPRRKSLIFDRNSIAGGPKLAAALARRALARARDTFIPQELIQEIRRGELTPETEEAMELIRQMTLLNAMEEEDDEEPKEPAPQQDAQMTINMDNEFWYTFYTVLAICGIAFCFPVKTPTALILLTCQFVYILATESIARQFSAYRSSLKYTDLKRRVPVIIFDWVLRSTYKLRSVPMQAAIMKAVWLWAAVYLLLVYPSASVFELDSGFYKYDHLMYIVAAAIYISRQSTKAEKPALPPQQSTTEDGAARFVRAMSVLQEASLSSNKELGEKILSATGDLNKVELNTCIFVLSRQQIRSFSDRHPETILLLVSERVTEFDMFTKIRIIDSIMMGDISSSIPVQIMITTMLRAIYGNHYGQFKTQFDMLGNGHSLRNLVTECITDPWCKSTLLKHMTRESCALHGYRLLRQDGQFSYMMKRAVKLACVPPEFEFLLEDRVLYEPRYMEANFEAPEEKKKKKKKRKNKKKKGAEGEENKAECTEGAASGVEKKDGEESSAAAAASTSPSKALQEKKQSSSSNISKEDSSKKDNKDNKESKDGKENSSSGNDKDDDESGSEWTTDSEGSESETEHVKDKPVEEGTTKEGEGKSEGGEGGEGGEGDAEAMGASGSEPLQDGEGAKKEGQQENMTPKNSSDSEASATAVAAAAAAATASTPKAAAAAAAASSSGNSNSNSKKKKSVPVVNVDGEAEGQDSATITGLVTTVPAEVGSSAAASGSKGEGITTSENAEAGEEEEAEEETPALTIPERMALTPWKKPIKPVYRTKSTFRPEELAKMKKDEMRIKRKILFDVDDTVLCSGGAHFAGCDRRYPHKTPYPGFFQFVKELHLGDCMGHMAALSARPGALEIDLAGKFRKIKEEHPALHAHPSLLLGEIGSGYTFVSNQGAPEGYRALAKTKLRRVREYIQIYPEYRFVFMGDNGQGDYWVAKEMCKEFRMFVDHIWIHKVQEIEKTPFWEKPDMKTLDMPINFVQDWVDAAIIAFQKKPKRLITLEGLQRVVNAAVEDFNKIEHWKSADARLLAEHRLCLSLRRAREVLQQYGVEIEELPWLEELEPVAEKDLFLIADEPSRISQFAEWMAANFTGRVKEPFPSLAQLWKYRQEEKEAKEAEAAAIAQAASQPALLGSAGLSDEARQEALASAGGASAPLLPISRTNTPPKEGGRGRVAAVWQGAARLFAKNAPETPPRDPSPAAPAAVTSTTPPPEGATSPPQTTTAEGVEEPPTRRFASVIHGAARLFGGKSETPLMSPRPEPQPQPQTEEPRSNEGSPPNRASTPPVRTTSATLSDDGGEEARTGRFASVIHGAARLFGAKSEEPARSSSQEPKADDSSAAAAAAEPASPEQQQKNTSAEPKSSASASASASAPAAAAAAAASGEEAATEESRTPEEAPAGWRATLVETGARLLRRGSRDQQDTSASFVSLPDSDTPEAS